MILGVIWGYTCKLCEMPLKFLMRVNRNTKPLVYILFSCAETMKNLTPKYNSSKVTRQK